MSIHTHIFKKEAMNLKEGNEHVWKTLGGEREEKNDVK